MAITLALTWSEKLVSVGLSTAAADELLVATETLIAIWSAGTDQTFAIRRRKRLVSKM